MSARTHRRLVLSSALGIAAIFASVAAECRRRTTGRLVGHRADPERTHRRLTSPQSARLAKSDAALVKRTDSKRVNVVIKLDYDAVASYAGGVDDLAATSPRVTGKPLTGKSKAETRYGTYIKGQEAGGHQGAQEGRPVDQGRRDAAHGVRRPRRLAERARGQGRAQGRRRRRRPGRRPAPAADRLELRLHRRDRGPGGPRRPTGRRLRASSTATSTSGVWPEHPSFADQGHLGAPPAKADGTPRACNFGDNPLTPATDVVRLQRQAHRRAAVPGHLPVQPDPRRRRAVPHGP